MLRGLGEKYRERKVRVCVWERDRRRDSVREKERERKREREREREKERKGERERKRVFVAEFVEFLFALC